MKKAKSILLFSSGFSTTNQFNLKSAHRIYIEVSTLQQLLRNVLLYRTDDFYILYDTTCCTTIDNSKFMILFFEEKIFLEAL